MNDIFKGLQTNKQQQQKHKKVINQEFYVQLNYSSNTKHEKTTFLDKQKPREFVARRLSIQEMLKEIL